VEPGANGDLLNEQLGRFGEENRSLGAYHLYVIVEFHNLFDSSQRQLRAFQINLLTRVN
jgi:hypothetical protein